MLRYPKLGVLFTRKKTEAFLRGDQSGTVLNRLFVRGAQLLGAMSCPDVDATPTMVRFHARRTQLTWEALAEVFNGKDYVLKAQAAVVVAAGFILISMTHLAIFYIQKGCGFIKAGNLQFVPTFGRPPEFSEDLHETSITLSQTIYWANYLFLMRGGPEPRAIAMLEREFRQVLPVCDIIPTPLHEESS